MFQTISLFRKPGASVSATASAPTSNGNGSSRASKPRSLELAFNSRDDPMEQLKQKLAQLQMSSSTRTTDSKDRSFPCLDENLSDSDSESCAAPMMSRANADSGFSDSEAFPYLAEYGRDFPLQPFSHNGYLSSAGSLSSPLSPKESAIQSLMSPKNHLVEMMAIQDMICVPPPPPPSPLIGGPPNQHSDWDLTEQQWNGLLASLLMEHAGRLSSH